MATEQAVIILHQGVRAGRTGNTDADLARSLASVARQQGPRPVVLCAASGGLLDHAPAVWDRAPGAGPRLWAPTPLDALQRALSRTDARQIFLLHSGDVWTPDKLVRGAAALADVAAWWHALAVGRERTACFFPGLAEARAFFRRTGLPLFHPPLSGLGLRRDDLERLAAAADSAFPLAWELGTGLLLDAAIANVRVTTDCLGTVHPLAAQETLGAPAVARLRERGVDPCFLDGVAERFPRLLALLRPRDVPAWEAQRFEVGAHRCTASTRIDHTPENLVLLALLLELGPGRFAPLVRFLADHPSMTHEREYAYAELLAPDTLLLHDADVPAYARLGRCFWPRSRAIRTHVLVRLLRADRCAEALALYDEDDVSDVIVRTLRAQCAFRLGDAARLAALTDRLLAIPEDRLTLVERTAIATTLAVTHQYAPALERLDRVRREIPYGEPLAVLRVTTLLGLGRREAAAAFVTAMEAAKALPLPGLIRLRWALGERDGVRRLLASYLPLDGTPEALARACDDPADARLLVQTLPALPPPQAAAVIEALAAGRGLADDDKGCLYKREGRFEAAMDFFSRVPPVAPRYAQARYLRAGCLAALHRYDEAEAGFREVLAADPERQDVFLNIIDLHKYRGQWEAAAALVARLQRLGRPVPGLARRERAIREGLEHARKR